MNCGEIVETIGRTSERETERVKAMLLVNYGPHGKCKNGIIDFQDSLESMVVKVCEKYEEREQALTRNNDKL